MSKISDLTTVVGCGSEGLAKRIPHRDNRQRHRSERWACECRSNASDKAGDELRRIIMKITFCLMIAACLAFVGCEPKPTDTNPAPKDGKTPVVAPATTNVNAPAAK